MKIIRRIVPSEIALSGSIHPLLQRIYAARGVRSADEIDYSLKRLHPYTALKGIETAVELLITALKAEQRILIVADYDADGATSCALAVRGLRAMGAKRVGYVVPNRFEYGYGLTPEIIAVAISYEPDLLITVDNGIASIEGVREAKQRGLGVVITDHHLPGATLPAADAIVNPNQPGCSFPSKNLAGVGVMFYVLMALRARLRAMGWFQARDLPETNLAELLDLVALGTVADVVPLDSNNRILVAQGLARMRAGYCRAGIRALIKVSGRDLSRLTASDLGFAIGPRLNAAGRLSDMSLGIECLLSEADSAALEMAKCLDELNHNRRAIEWQMQTQALAILETLTLEHSQDLPFGVCLFDEGWHQGVIGILAARIRERVHRPVIAFAKGHEGEIKGSARSVAGVHIRDVLDAVATRHPGLMTKFGGHAMAAGLSLARRDLAAFRRAFDEEVRRHLSIEALDGTIYTDGALDPADLTLELAEQLRYAGPWGQGFAEPIFDGRFEIIQRRVVADKHLKLLVRAANSAPIEAIAFNTRGENWPEDLRRVSLAYRLDVHEYQGMRSTQLIVEHVAPGL
jgi:single-stranded-DNA-specific exonuclease